MHMRYIESLLTLYTEKNMSKASQKLFISQQGLSRQIQSLEKELGVTLFERTSNGVHPTDICVTLYPNFVHMFELYTQTKYTISRHASEKRKSVVIAFAYGISLGLDTEVFLSFQREHPNIYFQVKEWSKQKCIDKLNKNEVDVALLVTPLDLKQFHTHRLTEGYMYVAIHKNHPLAKQEAISFKQLDDETIITGSDDNALRELFDYYCETTNTKPNIMFSSSYSLDVINSTTDDMILATVTPTMAEKITNPNMTVKRLLTPEPGYLYSCTSKTRNKSKEVDMVVNYIAEYFNDYPIIKIP